MSTSDRGPALTEEPTVLLLGGTGRTGRLALRQLLVRGVRVRAVVRSAARLPADAAADPRLTVVPADLLSLGGEALVDRVRGCDAVVSCLGHVLNLRGLFGPPHDLVTQAMKRTYRAVASIRPASPVRFILMTSVSVNDPPGDPTRRGWVERATLAVLRGLVPPARDNQRAADFLRREVGAANPLAQWVVVRPDTLLEGGVCAYTVHERLVDGLFAPGRTTMANVARFISDLVDTPATWEAWRGQLPVIVDAPATR